MNCIENELVSIKRNYRFHLSSQNKAQIQKFQLMLKEMSSHPFTKNSDEDPQNLLASVGQQVAGLKKKIQSELKMNLTDHEAFLKKHERNTDIPFPDSFARLSLVLKEQKKPPVTDAIKNLNFPMLSVKVKDLCFLASKIINYNFYCSENFDPQIINQLVLRIAERYNILSYHNFTHAFSVFLMMYQCKNRSSELQKTFTSYEFFISYIAALCHDINHSGTNSAYEIKKKTNLALKYDNESVLENMHISHLFKMMRQNPKIDIFSTLKNPKEKERSRKLITKLIIATDPQLHGKKLTQFKQIQEKINEKKVEITTQENDIMLQNLFHACDIGNPCYQFDHYLDWAILLSHQFNYQAKMEERQNLQVTGFLVYKDLPTFYRSQIGFINFMAFPLWEQISVSWPQLLFMKRNIEGNIEGLNKLLENQ